MVQKKRGEEKKSTQPQSGPIALPNACGTKMDAERRGEGGEPAHAL